MSVQVNILVGDEAGGLIRVASEDDGRSWKQPEVIVPDVEACAFASTSDGTVYVGTRGHGLLRSRDGLRTWEAVETTPAAQKIRSLAWRGDHLLLGTEPAGIYEYAPDGTCRALGDIWLAEGSSQWFYPVKIEAVHIRGLAADPREPGRIYAAVQVGGVGISPDDGQTWYDKRNLDLDVHCVQPHATKPGVVYAGSGGGGLYRSTDRGESWRCISEECGQFVLDFAVDPLDPDRMYLGTARGGFQSWAGPARARGEIFGTVDGGDTWSKLSGGLPEQLQSRITAIVVDRDAPANVYFAGGLPARGNIPLHADDAGVYHSADNGQSWMQIFSMNHGEPPAIWCVRT